MKKRIKIISFGLGVFSLIFWGKLAQSEDMSIHPQPMLEKELENLGLTSSDIKLPSSLDLPLTIPSVEKLFDQGLNIFPLAEGWEQQLNQSTSLSNLFSIGSHLLMNPQTNKPEEFTSEDENDLSQIPLPYRLPIYRLIGDIDRSEKKLKLSVDSLSEAERKSILDFYLREHDASSGLYRKNQKIIYGKLKKFNQEPLLEAGRMTFKSVDETILLLEEVARTIKVSKRIRVNTRVGDILIGTSGDDVYSESDLANVALLIDPGGKNTYSAPAGLAKAGEVRLVIDSGSHVIVRTSSTTTGGAGTGLFGMGVMILTNSDGQNDIDTNSFSQGCGLGGIGVLKAKGKTYLKGKRYVQGAGIFGVGLLSLEEADASQLWAVQNGQGFGETRGVGLLSITGHDILIEGGLVEPDPREPLGAASLCQGVGIGPRAYAGGGVGLFSMKGDRNKIIGSYFAQGCGYWHGVGFFNIEGASNTLQSRRYDMGSGVHSAIGYFHLKGSDNRLINWGVGPAYGWDRSVGAATIEGSRNHIQAEWGAGTASIGSFSFSLINGDENTLILPDLGNGSLTRNNLGFSLHIINGSNNVLKNSFDYSPSSSTLRLRPNPWGLLVTNGVRFSSTLKPLEIAWPKPESNEALGEESVNLPALLESADLLPPEEKVDRWVDVAAAFSIDKETPRKALEKLLSLKEAELPFLIKTVDPVAIDQLIQLQTVIPAYGEKIIPSIKNYLTSPIASRTKILLLNFFEPMPLSKVLPELLEMILSSNLKLDARTDTDARAKASVLLSLGKLVSHERGDNPGIRTLLQSVGQALTHSSKKSIDEATQILSQCRYSEAFFLLTYNESSGFDDRQKILEAGPQDITAPLGEKGAQVLLHLLEKSMAGKNMVKDLESLNQNKDSIQTALTSGLDHENIMVKGAALIALGQWGDPQTADLIRPYLTHENGMLRYQSALALVRLGKFIPTKSQSQNDRMALVAALSQIEKNDLLSDLKASLKDPNPNIRTLALASLRSATSLPQKERTDLIRYVLKELAHDPSPSVQFELQTLK